MTLGKWRPCMSLSCHVRISEWICNLQFPECQRMSSSKQTHYLMFKWIPYRYVLTTQVIHLASLEKWLSVCLQTKLLWVWIPLLWRIELCLNAFDKLQKVRGQYGQTVLMGNCLTCLYVLALSVYWMLCCQLVRFRWCTWHENLWPQKRCLLRRKLTRNICK